MLENIAIDSAGVLSRNNVVVNGSGIQPIVFAHGFGCDHTMWRLVEPPFRDGYRTVLFDYVGSGKSDLSAFESSRYGTLDGYAQDLLQILDALDLHDVILVGHSVSSMIGVLAANRAPARFAKLVMVVPSPCFLNDPPYLGGFERADLEGLLELMERNFSGWVGSFAPVVMGNADRPELAAELEGSFCTTDPDVAKTFARATFFADNRIDVQRCKTPCLIIQVRDDNLVPIGVGDYLREQIEGSEHVMLDITGHCPQLSHPELTIDAIKRFLHPAVAI